MAPTASPSLLRAAGLAGVTVALAVLVTTWPLVLPGSGILGDPEVEALEHLWTLWLGAREGPLVIDTDLASWPRGYRWVLADPLNLLWFAPVGWMSAVAGFHAVAVGNLVMAAVAAVVAGRLLLPGETAPAWAVGPLAVLTAPLAGNLVTGMTEAATVWAAVLAVALLRPALMRGGVWVGAAGIAGGLAAWGGPYTAVYAALLAPIVVVPALWSARGPGLVRALGVVGLAGVLAAPVAWAIATQRPEGLPGTASLLTQVLASPEVPHTRALGADPLHVFLPLSVPEVAQVQATYLGVGVVLFAMLGIVRRRAWVLGGLVVWAVVLGLGVYLQLAGQIPRSGGRLLLLPAGLLSLVVEPLGRAARWHRLLGAAAILLAPAAVAGLQVLVGRLPARVRGGALGLGIVALGVDLLVMAPVPWPRPTQPATVPALYAALDAPGPVIAVPKQPQRIATLPRSPARQLLWQTRHGRAIAEKPMFQRTDPEVHALRDGVRTAALRGDSQKANRARQGLAQLGFVWIVHHDEPGNPVRADQLQAVLGEPDVEVDGGMGWRVK